MYSILTVAVVVTGLQDSLLTKLHLRADSLATEWHRANAMADVVDSLERERASAGSDTIVVGSMRIIANPSPLPLRAAAARAWPLLDSLYGSAAPDLLADPYFIRAVDPDTGVQRSALHVGIEVPWDLSLETTTMLLISAAPVATPDSALANWLGGPLRPALHPAADRTAVYLQLVTAPSGPVRACFLGEIARCADVLELRPGDPLERWYPAPAERRALVLGSFSEYFHRGATAQPLRNCAAGYDDACTELLHALPPGTVPKPLNYAARAMLLRLTLQVGGRDAYRRLAHDPTASMAERIAAAGALPVDSLVSRWRSEALAGRPSTVRLAPIALLAAVGWLVVFAGFGMRSSRWRL